MTIAPTNTPPLTVKNTPVKSTHKKPRSFFREIDDDIMDEYETNSNTTQNETNPAEPVTENIMKTPANLPPTSPTQHPPLTAKNLSMQRNYRQLTFTKVPVSPHNSNSPNKQNAIHKRKLENNTPVTMSNPTVKRGLAEQRIDSINKRVCSSFNKIRYDGNKITVQEVAHLRSCIDIAEAQYTEHEILDLTASKVPNKDQEPSPITKEQHTQGVETKHNAIVPKPNVSEDKIKDANGTAALDTTQTTTTNNPRVDPKEDRALALALESSQYDATSTHVTPSMNQDNTPNKDTDLNVKQRSTPRFKGRAINFTQQQLGDIPVPEFSWAPTTKQCKGIPDETMTKWIRARYPLLSGDLNLHCNAHENKRFTLRTAASFTGKTFTDASFNNLLDSNNVNDNVLPLIDLFNDAEMNKVLCAENYILLQDKLHHDSTIFGLLQGRSGKNFGGLMPSAHPIVCAMRARATGETTYMYRYVIYVPMLNAIITPRGNDEGKNTKTKFHCYVLGQNVHDALAQKDQFKLDLLVAGKIFPGDDKVKELTLMSAIILHEHIQR